MTRTDVVTNVVKAVAAQDEGEPGELDPLYEYIDPEILVASQNRLDFTSSSLN